MGSLRVDGVGFGKVESLALDGERVGGGGDGMGLKAAMALKNHSEAERRRRERINAHLDTLRSIVPGAQMVIGANNEGEKALPANAYTINGHPGHLYNCSIHDVFVMEVVPGRTYLLRLINAGLNTELFFSIAGHRMTIVEADADYTKPFTVDQLMLGPGQTTNVLVTADRQIGRYDMAVGPYISARNVPFQNIPAVAYFQYTGASINTLTLPAALPAFNDNLVVRRGLAGLRSLDAADLPMGVDREFFYTVGLNVQQCRYGDPRKNCRGTNNGVFAASINNISFVRPTETSLLEAYYGEVSGHFTADLDLGDGREEPGPGGQTTVSASVLPLRRERIEDLDMGDGREEPGEVAAVDEVANGRIDWYESYEMETMGKNYI